MSLSADGNTLAVGAPREDSNGTGQQNEEAPGAGAAYVFKRNSTGWSVATYLKASDIVAGDEFGISVSLSANGNALAVGASGRGILDDDNSANLPGAVYVFTHNGEEWSAPDRLLTNNAEAGDRFGQSVSISADGDTLAVGAYLEGSDATGLAVNGDLTNNETLLSGAVYTYARSAASWSQQAYIKASNTGRW